MNRSPGPRVSANVFETAVPLRAVTTQTSEQLTPITPEILRSIPERFTDKTLGRLVSDAEPELPVAKHREEIITNVHNNQIVILTGETGSGKSTQIVQMLLEAGYNTFETQPRRIATQLVAEEIDKQLHAVLGSEADGLVAVHTARTNTTIPGKTRVTIMTDGVRLVQEFGEREEVEHEVLVIDEVHEWNENIELLVANVKRLADEKPNLRVVILSATMEADKLADHFSKGSESKRPPVMEVKGRNFEGRTIEEPNSDVVIEAMKYADLGENVLVFLPGVREIQDTIRTIKKDYAKRGVTNITVLPFYSKLSRARQEAVAKEYPGPVIICATNIAQTSVTLNVGVVVQSSLFRREEIDDEGAASLVLRPVSRADMMQQAGRTSRLAPGLVVQTRLSSEMPFIPFDSPLRDDYPTAAISLTDADRSVLLLARKNLDFETMEPFHDISDVVIERSRQTLRNLGALDENNTITERGKRMVEFPMRPLYGRMMIEALEQDYPSIVKNYTAAMVAAMEVGGMRLWLHTPSQDLAKMSQEKTSDHFTQLDIFINAQSLSPYDRRRIGIDTNNFDLATELYTKICKRSGIAPIRLHTVPTEEERTQLRRAVAAGLVDYSYRRASKTDYLRVGGSATLRSKSKRSAVVGHPAMVVGIPYRIERLRGDEEHIIQDMTEVTPQLLGSIALDLCAWEDVEVAWRGGTLKRIQRELFRGSIATGRTREELAVASPEVYSVIEQYLLQNSGSALQQLKSTKSELEELQRLSIQKLPRITQDDIQSILREAMGDRTVDTGYIDQRIREITASRSLNIDALMSRDARQKVRDAAPPYISHQGQNLKLQYHYGLPEHHINTLEDIRLWSSVPTLDDGRTVKLIHNRRTYTFDELRELLNAS